MVVSFFKCNAGKGKVRQMAVSEYHLESLKIAKSIWFFFGRFLGWIMSNSWGDLIRILGGCLWIFLSFFLSFSFGILQHLDRIFRIPSQFPMFIGCPQIFYLQSQNFIFDFFFLLWDIRNSYCVCVFENYFFIDSSDLARLGRILSSFFSLFFFFFFVFFFFFFFFSSLNMLEDCLSVGKYSRGTRKVPCDSWRWIPATAEDVLVLKYRSLWGL